MNRIVITLAICVTILLGLSMLSAVPQEQPAQPAEIGRYQLMGGGGHAIYLVDTATGQVWGKENFHGDWRDMRSPVRRR